MSNLVSQLQLGKTTRVVGTIITADHLRRWSAAPAPLPCDLVELRVDGFPEFDRWIEIGRHIEKAGTPVFATIRSAREGGHWQSDEGKRRELLESALETISGIDIELNSEIADALAQRARASGKLCILSFHDFQRTPPRMDLEALLMRMQESGSVAKIAATANSAADVETLRSLLAQPWKVPVCIIGMGAHGRETRLEFPRYGSCLTYGYLDTPGAPGQYSAAELWRHFRS